MSTEQSITPYIVTKGASKAIDFYRDAFGAAELFRMTDPSDSGKIGHAELQIGGSILYLADEYPDFGAISPDTLGGTPVTLHLRVEDCDAATERAEQAGAMVLRRPKTQSFGDRNAVVQDPFGHRWMLGQVVEEMAPEEMQRRWEAETVG